MKKPRIALAIAALTLASAAFIVPGIAQQGPPPDGRPPRFGGPGGPGPGPGGPGGPMQQPLELVKRFDKDGDGRLNLAERKPAREAAKQERAQRGGPGRGPGGPRREGGEPVSPGAKVSPAEVKTFPNAPLYDPQTLRTFFLEFESADWEKELADFNNTDVEVPAKMTVDGKTFDNVGVHFRGASSFFSLNDGQKRSLNIAMDFANKDQNLYGYHTLNLLNSHGDPSFLRAVLYHHIAREYLPAPKANFARVVINGESWGVYANVEQFNKQLIQEWFGTSKGARWKVPGSPRGRGNLAYIGDDVAAYKEIYEIKSKDDKKSWAALINLCKVLTETPTDRLQQALAPIFDVDGALKFLALENALINNDGYWVRTSDYSIYLDEKGKFHILPHDANETFMRAGGFGRRGGPDNNARPEGVKLDPLYAAADANKPIISKLLAVPAYRAKYLGYMRDIAEKWLDWKKLGPIAEQYHNSIASEVRADTRKLDSTEHFEQSLTQDTAGEGFGPGGGGSIGLKNFADQRRAYLLDHPEIKKLAR